MLAPKLDGAPKTLDAQNDIQLKEKLQALTDSDIADYYRLKNLEDKYTKADEILGKIMTIFLTDLGLRVSKRTEEQIHQALEKNPLPTSNSKGLVAKTENITKPIGIPKDDKWTINEKPLHEISNERDIPDFLEKVKIDKIDEALKSSVSFANRTSTLDALKGKFSGTSQVKIEEKIHLWDLDLFLNAEMVGGVLTGKAQIKMAENGKIFSDSSHGGDIRAFREFTLGSEAVFINASPNVVFQLYYFKSMDTLSGNIYQKIRGSETFSYIGTLRLRRSE